MIQAAFFGVFAFGFLIGCFVGWSVARTEDTQ